MVYEAQGSDVPTALSENFDPSIFAHIYADKEERERLWRERRMRTQRATNSSLPNTYTSTHNIPGAMIIDVDMEVDEGSDWELGSGVGSEDGEGAAAGVGEVAAADEGDEAAVEEL
jgi:hypothetical protein